LGIFDKRKGVRDLDRKRQRRYRNALSDCNMKEIANSCDNWILSFKQCGIYFPGYTAGSISAVLKDTGLIFYLRFNGEADVR